MSKSVGVRCAMCQEDIGEQFESGDGEALFRAHLAEKHPREAKALRAAEEAVIRIPWPAKPASSQSEEGEREHGAG